MSKEQTQRVKVWENKAGENVGIEIINFINSILIASSIKIHHVNPGALISFRMIPCAPIMALTASSL